VQLARLAFKALQGQQALKAQLEPLELMGLMVPLELLAPLALKVLRALRETLARLVRPDPLASLGPRAWLVQSAQLVRQE
jgi:hypothetical protein